MSVGGMNFAYSSPTQGNVRRYLPETVISILDQVGLSHQTIGIDPMNMGKKEDGDKGYKYRRWGIEAMDDSMYVSDGTTKDGGTVRIKVADKLQTEINKTKPISDYGNHIVYTKDISNYKDWNDNALIHKGAINDLAQGKPGRDGKDGKDGRDGKDTLTKNLKDIDKTIELNKDTGFLRYKHMPIPQPPIPVPDDPGKFPEQPGIPTPPEQPPKVPTMPMPPGKKR